MGAKREIHFLLRDLADRGAAIVMVSSELDEILGMPSHIYVMYRGRVIVECEGGKTTNQGTTEAIVTAARRGEKGGEGIEQAAQERFGRQDLARSGQLLTRGSKAREFVLIVLLVVLVSFFGATVGGLMRCTTCGLRRLPW